MPKPNLEKLLEQQKQIDAKVKLAKNRLAKQDKKDDTRRKILAGAYVLEKCQKNENYPDFVKELDKFLFRKSDRSLFGLPSRESEDIKETVSEVIMQELEMA
jgi:large subunit ribosomal protein L7/L12